MAFTLTPFLYQTRTLQRLTRSPSTIHGLRLLSTSRPRQASRRNADPIPFELPPELESESPDKIFEDEDVGPDGTITPAERQTFQRIFEEIAERSPKRSHALQGTSASRSAARKRESAVSVIFRDATNKVAGQGAGDIDPLSALEDAYSAAARQEALMRFPASLRHAARQALGVDQEEGHGDYRLYEAISSSDHSVDSVDKDSGSSPAKEELGEEALAEARQLQMQRKTERLRIETLMKAAQTDFELWDVLEEQVFPMVEKLGIGQVNLGQNAVQGKRARQKKLAKNNKDTPLSMEVHGPLYPDFLLRALELFDQRFSSPSRLSFSILPRVKELGLASYVLGINVPFYNKLMKIYWERYGDANAVMSLLGEMQHAGVLFDETTYGVVDSISNFQGLAARNFKGPWRQALMTMPEFESVMEVKAKYWSNVIKKGMHKHADAL